jgi:hypothetical protein
MLANFRKNVVNTSGKCWRKNVGNTSEKCWRKNVDNTLTNVEKILATLPENVDNILKNVDEKMFAKKIFTTVQIK